MDFKSKNKYKITFQDGSHIESDGSGSGIRKSKTCDDLEFLGFHIIKEVVSAGKKDKDIKKVEITIEYDNE